MATTPTTAGNKPFDASFSAESMVVTWSAVVNADTGTAVEYASFADRSVQIGGTFGGATVVLQGSNDGSSWFTLNDLFGAAISATVAGLFGVAEATRYVRPSVSGGDGTTSINVYLFARRN